MIPTSRPPLERFGWWSGWRVCICHAGYHVAGKNTFVCKVRQLNEIASNWLSELRRIIWWRYLLACVWYSVGWLYINCRNKYCLDLQYKSCCTEAEVYILTCTWIVRTLKTVKCNTKLKFSNIRPNKKKYLVSVTLSQIFRGGRAGFFKNFYSFFNFLIVFFGGMGAVFPPYRWYFLCWSCEGRHFALRTLYTQAYALLSISI
jgi:hypothetical protein